MTHKGLRYNKGKLRYDLKPPFAEQEYVRVLTVGAEKYAERNWENGMSWSNVIASAERHLAAIKKGEDYDKETGILHSAHLQANAAFLTEYYKIYPQGDDRPHKYLKPLRIGLDIDEVLCDFVSEWVRLFNQHIPTSWRFDRDIKSKFEKMKHDKSFWISLPVKTNPSDIHFEPVCYITSRPIPVEWTEEWLDLNGFPAMPVYSCDSGESKVEYAKNEKLDIFVDDRYENFVELNQNGICCYIFDAPHNQRYDVGHKRIKSISDLL